MESNLIVQAMYSDTADSPRDDVSDDGQQTMTARDMESDLIAALNQIFGSDSDNFRSFLLKLLVIAT